MTFRYVYWNISTQTESKNTSLSYGHHTVGHFILCAGSF